MTICWNKKHNIKKQHNHMKITSLPSLTTCSWVAESYLEVKHTPPEISVGNIKNVGKVSGRWTNGRVYTMFTCPSHSGAHVDYGKNPNTMVTQTIVYCLSCFLRQPCVCALWLVLCVKRRRGRRWTDREGGRRCGRWWGKMSGDAAYW